MLVDLARNDIGRVCQYGSIEVPDYMVIERYSHVMHIVSQVVGTIADDKTAYDLMRATFPAGTLSGAPKVRAPQIIAELRTASVVSTVVRSAILATRATTTPVSAFGLR